MPVPISTLNPWDIDNQTNKPKRIFFPELVYCYEKNIYTCIYDGVFELQCLCGKFKLQLY